MKITADVLINPTYDKVFLKDWIANNETTTIYNINLLLKDPVLCIVSRNTHRTDRETKC